MISRLAQRVRRFVWLLNKCADATLFKSHLVNVHNHAWKPATPSKTSGTSAVSSKSSFMLPSARWSSAHSGTLLYWVGSLIPKTPSSSMCPSSLSGCMLTFTYTNSITQDEFKLFRVGVRSFPQRDHTRSTRVPVAFATKYRHNWAKLTAWRDRCNHNSVSPIIFCRVVVKNA